MLWTILFYLADTNGLEKTDYQQTNVLTQLNTIGKKNVSNLNKPIIFKCNKYNKAIT